MKLTVVYIFGFLFCVTFFISALVWHWQMSDVYFVSHAKGPIADFVPPFVLPGDNGDYYIKPRRVVYVIWGIYAGCSVMIPAVCSWLLMRMHQRALNKSWM
jgi:hypothetical protein